MPRNRMRTLRNLVPAFFISVGLHTLAVGAPAQRPGETRSTSYADGVYTATGQYGGQPSFITVTVALKDGVVTSVQVRPHATVPRSLELQRAFAAAVPKVVVGKPLSEVRVDKLAGSSGTPKGFNDAIDKIRQEAAR